MRILHLIDSSGLYGAERMLLALVTAQVEQGLKPTILSAGVHESGEKLIELEAKRLGLPLKTWRMKPGLNVTEAIKIVRWANSQCFELFHAHGYKFNILIGLLPRGIRKKPFVTTVHGYVHARAYSKMWLYQWLDRKALSRIDHVTLVGEGIRRELPATLVNSHKVSVIHNGLDIEKLLVASGSSVSGPIGAFMREHSPLVVGVGRLSPEKGFNSLIRALPLLLRERPRAGLLILGEGHLRAEFESLVAQLKIADNILLPGYCSEVPSVLNQADVLVMPSLTEGLPITLLETMALKTPVVASAVGEIPTVLGHGKGGVVLEEPVPEAIAEAIENVLSMEGKQSETTRWAAETVHERYTNQAMEAGYRDVYRRLVG